MHQTIIDLDPTLSSYGAGVPTHHVHIAQGALAAAEDLMAQALPVGCWPYACHIFSGRSSSAIAALLEESVKTPSYAPPIGVLAYIHLLTAAPYRMIAARFGDLISKHVSQAD